ALFNERKTSREDGPHGRIVHIVNERAKSAAGKHHREWRTDMAGAADHANVIRRCGHGLSSTHLASSGRTRHAASQPRRPPSATGGGIPWSASCPEARRA